MIKRETLQKIIGDVIVPRDLLLYNEAFIHKSAHKMYGISQERLEHLGDAVLSLCVTHMLFEKNHSDSEGILTRMRTRLVNGKTLASIGRSMGVEESLMIDPAAANGSYHDRVFEDTFEALVGAVYLDLGLDATKRFVAYQFDKHLDPDTINQDTNFKDILKRITQKNGLQVPNYHTENISGVHTCTVRIGDGISAIGEGTSKKNAEMESAQNCILQHFPEYNDEKIS